jgi:hypothetical protein
LRDIAPAVDRTNNAVVIWGTLFSGLAAAHLIDEFVWGAPAEFHLSVVTTEVLALVFLTALAGLVAVAAKGSRAGYLGLAIAGFLVGVADALKHAPEIARPGAWRSGLVSEGLAIALTVVALLTGLTSALAYRRRRKGLHKDTASNG